MRHNTCSMLFNSTLRPTHFLFAISNAFTAELCITIPEEHKNRIVNSLGYKEEIRNLVGEGKIPNPESKIQFMKRMIIEFLKNNVKSIEANRDVNIARKNAIEKVDSEIEIQ